MNDSISEYFSALERLRRKKAKINNDTVAIEAGRKKGSIKNSRPQHAELIAAIAAASKEFSTATPSPKHVAEGLRAKKKELQDRLDEALARELSLVREVFHLKRELVALRGGTVLPIRQKQASSQATG